MMERTSFGVWELAARLGTLHHRNGFDSLRRRDQRFERLDGDSRQFHHPLRLHWSWTIFGKLWLSASWDLDVIDPYTSHQLDATWSPKQMDRERDLLIDHDNALGSVLNVHQHLQETNGFTWDCYRFLLDWHRLVSCYFGMMKLNFVGRA